MKIQQLSLFLENKPRTLRVPTKVLADAGINILTMSLADTEQFGILRLIVQDAPKAKAVLEKAGCVVNLTEVIAVEVPDRPGGLDGVLAVIEQSELNIEYVYSFTARRGDRAVMVFRFDNPDQALKTLTAKRVGVITELEQLTKD
ncbi:MAG: amino acid-binding protein [Phycisphaerae bacterium]|nr:amino acid-binding protein [Phycisphaerae bacterium]